MSDKDRIKNASHNVIDLMSKFGKQFLSEAIDQGEPIIDLINNITKSNEEETKNSNNLKKKGAWLDINECISYNGPENVVHELIETDSSYTILFILYGVNRQDFILEKNDNSLEVFCKTSISDSRILGFKYKEREIKFNVKFNFDIQCLNILAELKDGLLKIDIEKPHEDTDDDLITIV